MKGLILNFPVVVVLSMTIVVAMVISVSGVARGDTLSLTTPGSGSVAIPAGYEWTNVTVQCWSGRRGGSDYFGGARGGGGAASGGSGGLVLAGTGYQGGNGCKGGMAGDFEPGGPTLGAGGGGVAGARRAA